MHIVLLYTVVLLLYYCLYTAILLLIYCYITAYITAYILLYYYLYTVVLLLIYCLLLLIYCYITAYILSLTAIHLHHALGLWHQILFIAVIPAVIPGVSPVYCYPSSLLLFTAFISCLTVV